MILSDGEIVVALNEGKIIFDPPLSNSELELALTTSALDLRLNSELQFYKPLDEVLPRSAAGQLAARVEGKSTLARLGFVVHMTAPTIHCGFDGKIVLEMFNFGCYPIRLTNKMRICQLIFERLGEEPSQPQQTQYMGQRGPT